MWRTTVRSLVWASREGFCHTADRPGVSPQGHRRNPRGHAVARCYKLIHIDLLSSRTAAVCSCAHARLLSTTCQRRKALELQVQKTPENPTPPRRGQCGRLVPDENCRQSLAGAWRAAFLGCPRPPTRSPRTALCGPGAASRPSVRRLSVWIDLIGMGQALAGHGPASGPASGARKRSGRTLQRPRPCGARETLANSSRLKC